MAAAALCTTPVHAAATAVERLQLRDGEITWLLCGQHTGRWLRFRLRVGTSENHLFSHPSAYSRTWHALPERDAYGQPRVSELVFVGGTKLRLAFSVGMAAAATLLDDANTVDGESHDGVIALGPGSALWSVWRAFTRTRDELVLGELDWRLLNAARGGGGAPLQLGSPPQWQYGTSTASAPSALPAFAATFQARLDAAARASLAESCRRVLLTPGGAHDLRTLLANDELAAQLLALSSRRSDAAPLPPPPPRSVEDECAQAVNATYRVLLLPESDYNIVPAHLLVHAPMDPPLFQLIASSSTSVAATVERSSDSTGAAASSQPRMRALLFDVHRDRYTEENSGSITTLLANRLGARSDEIVLGALALRRFVVAYDLDNGTALLAPSALRDAGSALGGASSGLMSGDTDAHLLRDIGLVLVGGALWAMWLVVMAPVITPSKAIAAAATRLDVPPPPPRQQRLASSAASSKQETLIQRTTRPSATDQTLTSTTRRRINSARAPSAAAAAAASATTSESHDEDGVLRLVIEKPTSLRHESTTATTTSTPTAMQEQRRQQRQRREDTDTNAAAVTRVRQRSDTRSAVLQHVAPMPLPTVSDEHGAVAAVAEQRRRRAAAAETVRLRLSAAYNAVAHARAEWPYTMRTMRAAHDITDAVLCMYMVLAISYFDTAHALSIMARASSAAGVCILVAVVALVGTLSTGARALMRLSPRNSAHCVQLSVLLTLWLVNAPLFDWDFTLVVLALYALLSCTTAALLLVHSAWPDTLSGQRHYRRTAPLLVPLAVLALALLTFTALVVMRFTMERLWEQDHPNLSALSTFATLATVVPLTAFIANREALYPLLLFQQLARRIGNDAAVAAASLK